MVKETHQQVIDYIATNPSLSCKEYGHRLNYSESGIRYICKKHGISINADKSQQERREREKPYRVLDALKGLASVNSPVEDIFERVVNILLKYLQKDAEGTVKALCPSNDIFTAESLLETAFSVVVEEVLRQSGRFIYIGDGLWKLIEYSSENK